MFITIFCKSRNLSKQLKCPTVYSMEYNAGIKNHIEPENIHGKMFVILLSERGRFQNHVYNKNIVFKDREVPLLKEKSAKTRPGTDCGSGNFLSQRQRIDAFELWCWRRLLRVPWIAKRSNQSILKEISPGCSLEGLMLKLKLQYFGHLM